MKLLRYITYVLMLPMMSTVLLTSCEQDGNGVHIESPDGAPVIEYIRLSNPNTSDSLIVAAELGQEIVIIGSNLGGTRQVYFNDLEAEINPTWVTNRTIFVAVPGEAPTKVTDKIYLVNAGGDTMAYDFQVQIAPPVIDRLKSEWVPDGGELVIEGNYFFEPITVMLPGDIEGEISSIDQNTIRVIVPEGISSGTVSVTTNFGNVVSAQIFRDSRGIFGTMEPDDYDGNLWHNRSWFSSEVETPEVPNINGYYIRLDRTIAGGWQEWFVGQRSEDAGAPNTINIATQNIPDGAFISPDKYSLKFEMITLDTTDAEEGWHFYINSGSVDPGRTQSAAGGTRAYEWTPGLINTGGEWETMSIPMSEILKNNTFAPSPIGYSFSFFYWNFAGTFEVDFAIDNIRIVPNP